MRNPDAGSTDGSRDRIVPSLSSFLRRRGPPRAGTRESRTLNGVIKLTFRVKVTRAGETTGLLATFGRVDHDSEVVNLVSLDCT